VYGIFSLQKKRKKGKAILEPITLSLLGGAKEGGRKETLDPRRSKRGEERGDR